MVPTPVCCDSFGPDELRTCTGWAASGRALSCRVGLKLSCVNAVERVKLGSNNKMDPVTRNGFDHRTTSNNKTTAIVGEYSPCWPSRTPQEGYSLSRRIG